MFARVPPPVLWLGVVAAVWGLSGGSPVRAVGAHAYADAVDYAVGPIAAGRIKSVAVKVGARVRAGDVVAVMDPREIEARLRRVRAELAQAESQVAAQRDLQEASLARTGILFVRARAGEVRDREELKELSAQLGRLDGLAKEQMVTASEVEAARRRETAVAARVATYDQLAIRGASTDGRRAASPTSLPDGRASIAARLEPYRQAIAVQQAALDETGVQLDELTLRAPVDGVVSLVAHHAGEVVGAGTAVVEVVASVPDTIVAIVNEARARSVAVGARAVVQRPGLLQPKLEGRVVEVAPQVDEVLPRFRASPSVPAWGRRVFVKLDHPTELLPGEAFDVRL
jgi:multidrug resistance efflux pump